ncbi:hypothetical protein [Flammeovirga sp. SJP92]|uniref:hypothetical protein n=1 Tax=Flammeovirga sp. SJP92 TaxID=1775430 RepID=UPI0007897CAF|nr:hypothetical protein [Flammeovirga sp. SJP92]KXX70608.1 hypothetical protein AVL50_07240 [Flammeovirga sp. SJP92]
MGEIADERGDICDQICEYLKIDENAYDAIFGDCIAGALEPSLITVENNIKLNKYIIEDGTLKVKDDTI